MVLINVSLTKDELADLAESAAHRQITLAECAAGRLAGMAKEQTRKQLAEVEVSISKTKAKGVYEELPDAVYPFDMTLGTFQGPAKAHPASTPMRLLLVQGNDRSEIPVSKGRLVVDDGVMTIELTMPGAEPAPEPEPEPTKRTPRRREEPPLNASLEGADAPEDE